MTSFAAHVDDYLRLRRSFGYKLVEHERLLRRFATRLDGAGIEVITVEHALAWALERDVPDSSGVPAMRLLVVRGFARYLAGVDPRTQIPPNGLISRRRQRRAPYIYSEHEICTLMAQARTGIRQTLVAATYETLIGLMAATGMRTGEAIGLDRDDIDWQQEVLLVRESKFNKSRYIPIDATTVQALDRYGHLRDRLCPTPRTRSCFVSLRHGRLGETAVHATFRRLCRNARIGTDAPFAPRLHDLRHTLAVRTLLGWYREGVDVHARLPILSTFLGHRDPTDTYYYLSAAPELLAHAARMLDAHQEVRS